MANWLKEELAETERILQDSIRLAGSEINVTIEKVGRELSDQRRFTKDDLKDLVDYATASLDEVIDKRVGALKRELVSLAFWFFFLALVGCVVAWVIFRSRG